MIPRERTTILPWWTLLGFACVIGLLLPTTPIAGQEAAEPTGRLEITVDPEIDEQIADGLRRRFAEIDGLRDVEVAVSAGVVTLSGGVLHESARQTAVSLAGRVEGVAKVDDRITVEVDPSERLKPALDNAMDRLHRLVTYLPLLAVSLVLVFLFVLLSRLIGGYDPLFARFTKNRFASDLLRQATRAAIILIGVLIALELLDATALVGALLGTAGVVGLALGFAFRDLVENYISSILLSIRQPFEPNDHVTIDGLEGRVIRLTSRATILMTLDGNHLRIPNSQVFKGVILNFSRNPRRRFDFGVGVGVGEDLSEAQRLGIEALHEMPGVLDDPAPLALIEALGDSNVLVRFYGWVDQASFSFGKVKSESIRRIKTVLEEAGMDLPEPIYRVHMIESDTIEDEPQPGRPSTMEPDAPVDLERDDSIERQIREELADSTTGTDLLSTDGPTE